jgi:hypothetical protein
MRDDERLAPPSAPDADARERTHAAFARLNAVLTDVASSMIDKMHERCPYRAKDDGCTFAGGCVNQRRDASHVGRTVWCGGDHQLRRAGE